MDFIKIKGANENNLKNIDLVLPRNKLIVFTGLSGSGKTSLAFDTIFAEGQRRYVESLSSYARLFLGQMQKPDVESIEGLSPAISIDQKTTARNPRSTVGTVTEVHDYLRLLYARTGVVHCPKCGKEISQQSVDQIVDRIMAYGEGSRILVTAPVARGKKGEYKKELESFRKSGYTRVKVDGEVRSLDEEIVLDKQIKHSISVVVDRLIVKSGIEKRLTDSVETALKLSDGLVVVDLDGKEQTFSTKYACPDCDISVSEVEPRLFSFNSPFGACPECTGLGFKQQLDPELIYGDGSKSLNEGALNVSAWNFDTSQIGSMYFKALSERYGFSLDTPFKDLPEKIKNILLYGNGDEKLDLKYVSANFTGSYRRSFEGVVNNLERRFRETSSDYIKSEISKYMREIPCEACGGKRLKKEALAVTVGGLNIAELSDMPIVKISKFMEELKFSPSNEIIARPILREIQARLKFLIDVGLGYLTLSRQRFRAERRNASGLPLR